MARILGSSLAWLDSIFSFVGSQVSTDELALEGGVQLVADVTELAALGGPPKGGFGGYAYMGLQTVIGAGNTSATDTIFPRTEAGGLAPWLATPLDPDVEVWVTGVGFSASGAQAHQAPAFANLSARVNLTQFVGGGASARTMLAAVDVANFPAGTYVGGVAPIAWPVRVMQTLPFLLVQSETPASLPELTLFARTPAAGAQTIDCIVQVALYSRGAHP